MVTTNQSPYIIGSDSYGINTGNNKHSCFTDILDAMHGQMQAMLSHHNKVIVVRVDLHCDKYTPCNSELSRFMCKVRKRLYSRYKCTRFGYLWVREQERSKSQHYHVMLIIDANKIQHPSALLGWLQERWSVRGHPRPYVPKHCFYKVHRGDDKAFGEAFYRCSYLAKVRGKGYGCLCANNYSGSRVRLKLANKVNGIH
jgi:hypothetical protein